MFKGNRSRRKLSNTITMSRPCSRSRSLNRISNVKYSKPKLTSSLNEKLDLIENELSEEKLAKENTLLDNLQNLLDENINLMDLPEFKEPENDQNISLEENKNELNVLCKSIDNKLICEGFLAKTTIDDLHHYIPQREITYITSIPIHKDKNIILQPYLESILNVQNIQSKEIKNEIDEINENNLTDKLYQNLFNIFSLQ